MSTTFFTVVWQYMQLWEKLKGEDEGAKHRMPFPHPLGLGQILTMLYSR